MENGGWISTAFSLVWNRGVGSITAANKGATSNGLVLRRLQPSDLTNILRLAESVGWGLSPQRVLTFLFTAVGVGHEYKGSLVSCTFHFRFDVELTFVGLVIVHPDFQGHGLGRQVLGACLAEDGYEPKRTALVATDAGAPLYLSEGFVTVERLNRFMGHADTELIRRWSESIPDEFAGEVIVTSIRHSPQEVLSEIVAFDTQVVGVNRESLYRGFVVGVTDFVVARDSLGKLLGYGMATVFGGEMMSISPLMATSPAVASKVAVTLIGNWRGEVRLDVPERQKVWSETLGEMGFCLQRQSPLMVKGLQELPGSREGLFSILDAAVG